MSTGSKNLSGSGFATIGLARQIFSPTTSFVRSLWVVFICLWGPGCFSFPVDVRSFPVGVFVFPCGGGGSVSMWVFCFSPVGGPISWVCVLRSRVWLVFPCAYKHAHCETARAGVCPWIFGAPRGFFSAFVSRAPHCCVGPRRLLGTPSFRRGRQAHVHDCCTLRRRMPHEAGSPSIV